MGVFLSDQQVQDYRSYTDLLLEANAQFNLTAIRDLPDIVAKIHLDSLSLIPAIAVAAGMDVESLRTQTWRAVDVGAGAGIPGIPLLLAWPSLALSLIESNGKKNKFLTRVIFSLSRVATVLTERAEVVGQTSGERESYDLVVARAVAALPTLVEYTLPLARIGGLVALSKGPNAPDEVQQARFAIAGLGGETLGIERLFTPGQSETRTVVFIRKKYATPPAYPRRPGHPAKQPLLTAVL